MNFWEKFLWELGVSVISDNEDNNFVEPCLRSPIRSFLGLIQSLLGIHIKFGCFRAESSLFEDLLCSGGPT